MQLGKIQFKIKITQLMTFLICFVFLPPQFLNHFSTISALLWYVKLMLMAYIALTIMKNIKNIGIATIVFGIYYSTFVISTILNEGNVSKSLSAVLPQLCFFAYSDIMIRKKTKDYINAVSMFFLSYIVINAILLLVFPNGIGAYLPGYDYLRVDSRMSWLGLDNGYIKFFLVAIVLFTFSYKDKPLVRNSMYICMMATMVYVWSGTGIVGITIMLGYIYLLNRSKYSFDLNYWVCLAIEIVAFLSIVIFRVTDKFSELIVNVIGKDITFTGRTILWDQAMLLIAKKPVWGYGVYDYNLLISTANGQAYSAHDTVLQMMLMGGIVSLIAFCIIKITIGIRLKKYGSIIENRSKKEINTTYMALLVMWICGITENMVFDIQIYFLYLIAVNLQYIVPEFQLQSNDNLIDKRI